MHAIILAGGFGTRLKSAVPDLPKPLAPIAGKPFIAWMVKTLAAQGITGITLCVHHQWEKIRDYFAEHPESVPIGYSVESIPLGTGGAMKHALKHQSANAPVLILNGDSFMRVDYQALFAHHRNGNACLTMVLREVPDTGRYGRVIVKKGVITSFEDGKLGKSGLINAGVYVMQPSIFEGNGLPEAFSFEHDFLPSRLEALRPQSYLAQEYFIDIGVPEDYARANEELPSILHNFRKP